MPHFVWYEIHDDDSFVKRLIETYISRLWKHQIHLECGMDSCPSHRRRRVSISLVVLQIYRSEEQTIAHLHEIVWHEKEIQVHTLFLLLRPWSHPTVVSRVQTHRIIATWPSKKGESQRRPLSLSNSMIEGDLLKKIASISKSNGNWVVVVVVSNWIVQSNSRDGQGF